MGQCLVITILPDSFESRQRRLNVIEKEWVANLKGKKVGLVTEICLQPLLLHRIGKVVLGCCRNCSVATFGIKSVSVSDNLCRPWKAIL